MINNNHPPVPANAPVAGIYEHYKGPRYQVLGTARHSETDEWLVLYQALYDEHGFWTRPLSLWLEPVSQDGALRDRFTLVSANDTSLEVLTQHS